MTPFDQNIDNDAGHTIDPSIDQDDLIAFHLRELPRQQKLAVLRALQTHPSLRVESTAIASTLRAFPKHEAPLPLDTAALDRHWLTLRRSLPIHVPPAVASRSLFPRWAIPTLAASALAATALILSLHHNPHTNPSTLATSKSPSFAITTPQLTKSAVPSDSTVPLYTAVPTNIAVSSNGATTHRSSPTANLSHSPFNDHPIPQPPTTSPQTQTSNNQPIPQPIITPSPTASSPASTTQQPSSLSSTTPTPSTALSNLPPSRPHHDHTTDLTLSALGNLTPDRSFTSTAGAGVSAVTASYTQSTTPSFGALASFHQQLRPWLGYRLTGSYSHPTFEYTYSTALGGSGNIVKERIYELSATYVVQGPHRHRITTSAEAGAALLAFHPTNPNQSISPPHATNLPAGVFGVSAELALTRHLALHAGYRALLYDIPANYPTYGATVPSAPGNLTLTSEPVAGITYRFHPTSE